jgi:subtilase family serine protease
MRRARSSSARRFSPGGAEPLEARSLLSQGLVAQPLVTVAATVAPAGAAGMDLFGAGLSPNRAHDGVVFGAVTPSASPSPAKASVVRPFAAAPAPYTPAQVRHAYGIDQLPVNGAGQTIAIIDAYDDPTIAGDLHVFDRTFGLPDPVLVKAMPEGRASFDPGWASEIALDVEWAHAIAPGAKILLVEAASASLSDLLGAVDYAVAQGAKQVSMSWGAPATYGLSALDAHFDRPGVSFTASSGDSGAGVSYPAASPFVTGVGGTSLWIDATGNRLAEAGWSGSGGGVTPAVARPPYQAGFIPVAERGAPDVSYDADPNTGYFVYDSSSGGGWYQDGGTSAGAPQWAGLFALANQARAVWGRPSLGTSLPFGTNQALYALAGGSRYTNPRGDFADVSSGSNGYPAGPGYDLVTGLGTPVANRLVPDLIFA